ncbi:MAG: hypothetical protein ACXAEN_23010 [Candidatus Thorarchaeota archaeon]
MKKCEYCYPDDKNVKEQIRQFHSYPFEIFIQETKHIAYNVIPDMDSYQTWCGIEFSMKHMKTHPKVGRIGEEPVCLIIDGSNAPKSMFAYYDLLRAAQHLRPDHQIKEGKPFFYKRNDPSQGDD